MSLTSIAKTKLALLSGPILAFSLLATPAVAQYCGDDLPFGECRVLVEINATDGDVGFHWLADGDELNATRIDDPSGHKVFENGAFGALREQKLTESFGESAEPPCWHQDGEADDEEIVTLLDFMDTWEAGDYFFIGKSDGGEKAYGMAELSYFLPAAPAEVNFDGSVVSWVPGDDLGNCTPEGGLQALVDDGTLPIHPEDVPVIAWEVVLEPDVDDTDARAGLVFSTRVGASANQVTIPSDYLASLGGNTPVKVEVGAIGGDFEIDEGEVNGDFDNATFTEEDGFCANEAGNGCEDD